MRCESSRVLRLGSVCMRQEYVPPGTDDSHFVDALAERVRIVLLTAHFEDSR
jgi:hypothetical protein